MRIITSVIQGGTRRARRQSPFFLQVSTESEAVSLALDIMVAEQEITETWKEVQGQGNLRKIFK